MAELTLTQIYFLQDQGIPMSQLFDATGMKKSEYKQIMKDLGMVVAIGVTPCNAAGHTLRTRHGHCVQCDCGTRNLAFLKRYDETGLVYVARSESIKLTKIGTARDDAAQREYSLNRSGYGGGSDWKIYFVQQCDKAGRVEFNVHKSLMPHNVSRSYWKQDMLVDCAELFNCEVELAIKTIEQFISQR